MSLATPSMDCTGRVALVTGASRGIGAAIAVRLARAGARVAATARTLEPAGDVEGSLRETVEAITCVGGEGVAIQADLSLADERTRLVDEVAHRLGPVDILVNDAAVTWMAPFDAVPDKRYRLMFELQVHAPFHLSQLVVPAMRAKGEGWIVNISSLAAVHAEGPPYAHMHTSLGLAAYGMCKAALERFTTALAGELHAAGIRVNALAPTGIVLTNGAKRLIIDGLAIEGPEYMAEAALALSSGPPDLTGLRAFSQSLLAELGLHTEVAEVSGPS